MSATMDWFLQEEPAAAPPVKQPAKPSPVAVVPVGSGPADPVPGTCGACCEFQASDLKGYGYCKAAKTPLLRARFVHVSTVCWK